MAAGERTRGICDVLACSDELHVRVGSQSRAKRLRAVTPSRHVDAESGAVIRVVVGGHYRPPITRARSAGLRPTSSPVSMLSTFSGLAPASVRWRSWRAHPRSAQ